MRVPGDVSVPIAVKAAQAGRHLVLDKPIAFTNEQAAEVVAAVRHAGAVFVGPWTPVALGDYAAGTNHVLPTAGTARFASGLSTLDFLRAMQVATFDRDALAAAAPTVAATAASGPHGTPPRPASPATSVQVAR